MKKKLLNNSSQKTFQSKKQLIEQVQQNENSGPQYDIFITQNVTRTNTPGKKIKKPMGSRKSSYVLEQQEIEEEFKKEEQQLKS